MKELSDACHKEGIKICWYHSIMDWHHPDYLPRRDWERDRPAEQADINRYVHHLKRQLKELLTNYGEIGVLWFDGEWESTWNNAYGKEICDYVRSLLDGRASSHSFRYHVEGRKFSFEYRPDFGRSLSGHIDQSPE